MGSGEVRLYEPLSKHTTLRVGGPAQFWIEPETRGGLANVLEFCAANRLPVMLVGRGSNLLVRDGGISGVVIHLNRGDFVALSCRGNGDSRGCGRSTEASRCGRAKRRDWGIRVDGRDSGKCWRQPPHECRSDGR